MNLTCYKKYGRYRPPYETPSLKTISAPRKSPWKRIFQKDQYQKFLASDVIACFKSLNEEYCPPGYSFSRHEGWVVCYKILLFAH